MCDFSKIVLGAKYDVNNGNVKDGLPISPVSTVPELPMFVTENAFHR